MTMSKSLSEQVANLETYLAEALVENRYLEAENAELRAGQGRWPEKADDFPCCTSTVPRVITADELQSGAKVATFTDQGRPVAGTVTGEATGKVTLLLHNDNIKGFDTERTFILLEDAPEPTSYADDDHQDAEVTQWHDPGLTAKTITTPDMQPRLTVHALNVAPVGSRVASEGLSFTKNHHGDWVSGSSIHLAYLPHEVIVYANEAVDATLHLPEQP